MKECPLCKQVYEDQELNFCLSDGMPLIITFDVHSHPTFVQPVAVPGKARKRVSPFFAYLSVGLLALIVGGAILIWMRPEFDGSISQNANRLTNESKEFHAADKNQNNPNKPRIESNAIRESVAIENEQEARAALDGWVESLVNHDLEKHMGYYADRLDFHRDKRNVDYRSVRNFNQKLFDKYARFELSIRNVTTRTAPNGEVVVLFESVYDYRGEKVHSGVDRHTEMRWKKIDGSWKIVSER